jgi:magnesium chelatase family protein
VNEDTLNCSANSVCVILRKSLRFSKCSPKVCGSKSYTLGINDLSEVRTYGKKATRLCPCGYLGHYSGKCHCTPDQIKRYRGKISGPLLDRIDLQIEVPAILPEELTRRVTQEEKSNQIQQRTEAARQRQLKRQGSTNNRLTVKEIDKYCQPDTDGENLLKQAIHRLNFSARAYHRVLKVARTIADLSSAHNINRQHIAEAIQYRRLDRNS